MAPYYEGHEQPRRQVMSPTRKIWASKPVRVTLKGIWRQFKKCSYTYQPLLHELFVPAENRFGFEVEITAKVAKGIWRVYEVPISYYGRSYSEGKKITWRDGVHALWCIIKYRFSR